MFPDAPRLMRREWLVLALAGGLSACAVRDQERPSSPALPRSPAEALAIPNDNRKPAGTLRDGVLEIDLVARPGRWEGEKSDLDPGAANPTIVDVLGFSEQGVTIPGPFIRVPQGPAPSSITRTWMNPISSHRAWSDRFWCSNRVGRTTPSGTASF